jgi:hypothetical protein
MGGGIKQLKFSLPGRITKATCPLCGVSIALPKTNVFPQILHFTCWPSILRSCEGSCMAEQCGHSQESVTGWYFDLRMA